MKRLLSLALGLGLITSVAAFVPVAATNSDGAAPLTDCSRGNGWAGGVQFYNLDGQEGGSRVWCVGESTIDSDPHFGGFPSGFGDGNVTDVGSFNDKTNSIKIRANPGCEVLLSAQADSDHSVGMGSWEVDNTTGSPVTENFNTINDEMTSAYLTGAC